MLCCGFKSKEQKLEVEEDKVILEDKQINNKSNNTISNNEADTDIPDLSVSSPAGSVFDAESVTTKGSTAAEHGSAKAPGIPRWWSQEEDEPPAPAVLGRDELALRRHRFFSADSAPLTHHVRFDPRGPTVLLPGFRGGITTAVANTNTSFDVDEGEGEDNNHTVAACTIMASELESLVTRLERVTSRLEKILPNNNNEDEEEIIERPSSPLPPPHLTPSPCSSATSTASTAALISSTNSPPPRTIKMASLNQFDDILSGPFATYLQTSKNIGGDVAEHAKLVDQAFKTQREYLCMAAQSRAPTASEQQQLLKPTSDKISAIQDYREKNRPSQYFNHLSAISESIPALGWIAVSPTPAPYVKEMNDAGQFYTNRVLKEWKEKDKVHVDWVHAWVQTLNELQKFVRTNHTTGLVWSGKDAPKAGGSSGGAAPPPPPPGCPPPPPVVDFSDLSVNDDGLDRSALFAQINQGEGITRSLKKVTSEMQTHKNPGLRSGPAPFKAQSNAVGSPGTKTVVAKPPSMVKDGKKWIIEYQKGRKDLTIDQVEMSNVIYMFRCEDSVLTVKGKLNSIVLDSCRKTAVVFDSVVSSIEFVNCQSVQMQVMGTVPTVSIDKTDGCQMYLSKDSPNVEIVSAKSSEMNIMLPDANGEFSEYPIPEQFKTTLNPNRKGITTTPVESLG